jgi:1,4-alpha-glucan branching enzyme
MIHKVASSKPGYVRVRFELPASVWADRISVTGDFNGWDRSATPLRQDRNGVWQATLDLCAGARYEFRYLIDGEWSTDFHADGCTNNPFGSQNSIVMAELALEPSEDGHADSAASVPSPLKLHARGFRSDPDNPHLDAAA